jgi:flagellar biosynthesis/type III secretory pathway protein FliH
MSERKRTLNWKSAWSERERTDPKEQA